MFTKLYEKVKDYMKENYLWLLFYVVFVAVMLYPLPYYIYTGGGIIDINDKVELANETKSKGNFNMSYVSEINATIPTYLLSYILPSWDLVAKKDVVLTDEETIQDNLIRDRIYLEEANQNAIFTAFSNTEATYQKKDSHHNIIYIDEDSDTNLKIGDEVLSIDGVKIHDFEEVVDLMQTKEIGENLKIMVARDGKIEERYVVVREKNNRKIMGVSFITTYDYETDPNVTFHFSKSESGPSGGLMLSLAIYDKLVEEDITHGFKIAGTGTIDQDGNVGSIGGVKYKLKGAVAGKADIFIVPNGENYEECIKLQKKYHYDIKIIGVSTFQEAIDELKKLSSDM